MQITGPLIRVIADRFAWQVKVAILETLEGLICKVGAQLKAFLPQLQTTFLKVCVQFHGIIHLGCALQLCIGDGVWVVLLEQSTCHSFLFLFGCCSTLKHAHEYISTP